MASVFTKIIAGELPCYKLHEDEWTLSFLTLEPIHLGHSLVISKKEINSWLDVPADIYTHVHLNSQKIGKAIKAATATIEAVKKLSSARTKTHARAAALRATVSALTGKKSIHACATGLQAIVGERDGLKAQRKQDRVESLLTKARAAGKIEEKELGHLRTQSVAWLKPYLASLSPKVKRVTDPATIGKTLDSTRTAGAGAEGGAATIAGALSAQGMDPEMRKHITAEAERAGRTFEDEMALMEKNRNRAGGLAGRR